MRLNVIDSHTGGEPTRLVLAQQIPVLGHTMADRRDDFQRRFDHFRTGIILEPRGNDVLVGALLTEPVTPGSHAGIIFFNNAGFLGMCGHGTIGVVESLRHLGNIGPGEIYFDTPAGTVRTVLAEDGTVSLTNVLSYRYRKDVCLAIPDFGEVVGDVAYGGNWFFIVTEPELPLHLREVAELTKLTTKIREVIALEGITGADGALIDHIELSGPSEIADSKNFVLCPGHAFDRSPCGTGTSAKLACLFADGKLKADTPYRQESITGSVFTGEVIAEGLGVIPTISGRASVTAESTLYFDPDDELRWGLPA